MKQYVMILLILLLLISAEAEVIYQAPDWADDAISILPCIDSIESEAFANCSSVEDVIIPGTVNYVAGDAFKNCKLQRVAVLTDDVRFDLSAVLKPGTGVEVWAPYNSDAQEYAEKNGITFHGLTIDPTPLMTYAAKCYSQGRKYVGGSWDCLFFVYYGYLNTYNIKLPDTPAGIYALDTFSSLKKQGYTPIKITSLDELKCGDILCWKSDTSTKCSHVGLYVGKMTKGGETYDNVFVHNSSSGGKVIYSTFDSNYYSRNFLCGWRVL